jgi:hypothetical protein
VPRENEDIFWNSDTVVFMEYGMAYAQMCDMKHLTTTGCVRAPPLTPSCPTFTRHALQPLKVPQHQNATGHVREGIDVLTNHTTRQIDILSIQKQEQKAALARTWSHWRWTLATRAWTKPTFCEPICCYHQKRRPYYLGPVSFLTPFHPHSSISGLVLLQQTQQPCA